MMRLPALGLYSTFYAGCRRFLQTWNASVKAQTIKPDLIVIGLDGVAPADAERAIGGPIQATWLLKGATESHTELRQRALRYIASAGIDQVVLVDADDILMPTRIEAARAMLGANDAVACSMEVVDESGEALIGRFLVPDRGTLRSLLPRANCFGMSNTAYSTIALQGIPTAPHDIVLLDWWLALHALSEGYVLGTDAIPQMKYRQYGANTARITKPVSGGQILSDTKVVKRFYAKILADPGALRGETRERVKEAHARAAEFWEIMTRDRDQLAQYTNCLNKTVENLMWWDTVAHPQLEEVWRRKP